MPLIILAALVVIVLMLYIALGGKEGAPTVSLNKIFDFISPKPPAGENPEDADAAAAGEANPGPVPEREEPKASEAPTPTPDARADAEFSSMEELTEFYRKEAERLTGIKH
jgi:hypothetical protein